jgi:glycosyltransferase involved in cell wall biosynthesis
MKFLCIFHMYPPLHNAGGETTVHSAMRAMVKRGHEVRVICRPHSEEIQFADYEFEGVKVVRPPRAGEAGYNPEVQEQAWIRKYAENLEPDLLITHLDLTTMAMQLSLDIGKPLAHFFHNTFSIPVFKVQPHKCQLAIFNSEWVAKDADWKGRQIIIHPVVEPDRYRCERGKKITLVNPTPGKGADTFYSVSKLLPDYEFLCVKSVYGEQIAVPNISAHLHPNVETMEHTADIREAFRKTKILIMPSEYESYGRVAIEAACCGIPTIAHPTPGLKEALGEAGIFVDRNDFAGYAAEIERMMTDDVYYRKRSDATLKLAGSLDPEFEYDRLENAMLVTAESWKARAEDKAMKLWTADRRIYKSQDGQRIKDYMEDGDSLFAAVGGQIPEDVAIHHGLISRPAVTVEPGIDTRAEAKVIEAPAENKANEAPEQKKTRTRRIA